MDSGPEIISRYLSPEDKLKYLQGGYRFQLIKYYLLFWLFSTPLLKYYSTWRPLIPNLEDRPLAFCDFRTVDPNDLIPQDRVFPQYVGEVYSVFYNERQEWYWTSRQNLDELYISIMYDSTAGAHARCKCRYLLYRVWTPANTPFVRLPPCIF